MKTKTSIVSLLLTLMLLFSVSMAVSASPAPIAGDEISAISLDTGGVPDSDLPESPGADMSSIQGENPDGPEAPDGLEQAAEETEPAPIPQKSNNTPFFIGAGIAVLLFIGVALYCKANGNKTL